ncbi:MAG: metallophosphatase [Synechococcales bacterium]|nr:metallophosphatase [Synechococcales bacterium]
MYWAIASGIEGNLAAYEAVLADIRQSHQRVEQLYLLGDLIGPQPDSAKVLDRIQTPQTGEPPIAACLGWWEEQLLILHGLGRSGEPTLLIERYGKPMVKILWDAVPRSQLEWIRHLEFGFVELDCLFIHGSSIAVEEALTPDTPVITLLDRLHRLEVNQLFCGRSGQAFEYHLTQGSLQDTVTTLDQPTVEHKVKLQPKRIVGVGNVGHHLGQATYLLLNPNSNELRFRTVNYKAKEGGV